MDVKWSNIWKTKTVRFTTMIITNNVWPFARHSWPGEKQIMVFFHWWPLSRFLFLCLICYKKVYPGSSPGETWATPEVSGSPFLYIHSISVFLDYMRFAGNWNLYLSLAAWGKRERNQKYNLTLTVTTATDKGQGTFLSSDKISQWLFYKERYCCWGFIFQKFYCTLSVPSSLSSI